MKTLASGAVLAVICVALSQVDYGFLHRIAPATLAWTAVGGLVGCLLGLVFFFIRAGSIRLEADHLAVRTPLGAADIPYARIETIRRSRSRRGQRLAIVFQSLGEKKVIRIKPRNLAVFAENLRVRCPHLSSSATTSIIRQGGYRELIREIA